MEKEKAKISRQCQYFINRHGTKLMKLIHDNFTGSNTELIEQFYRFEH